MPKPETVQDIIAELRQAPRIISHLRNLQDSPEKWELVKAALTQAGSMTAFAQSIGSNSYSTIGELFRQAGVPYQTLPGAAGMSSASASSVDEEEEDTCSVAYWKAKATRLEREQGKHRDFYGNVRAIMHDVMAEYPIEQAIPAYYQPITKDLADEEIPFILISDVHVGEQVTAAETSGLTTYNTEMFEDRCDTYRRGLDNIINGHLRKAYPMRTAYVGILGDVTTGEDIFPMQPHRIDRGLVYQMAEGAAHLARVLRWIAGAFEQVFVYAVPGNHGRTKTTTLNADFVLYMFMRERLANQKNLKFILSDSDMCGIYIDHTLGLLDWPEDILDKRWNYLFTHGHQTQGWMGLPYYGLDRFTQRIAPTTGIQWDHTFVGHHHTSGTSDNWTVVGSWVGGTDFSVGKMQAASQPKQLITGFSPRYGLTWSYPIYLGEKPRLTTESQATPGVYTPHNRVETLDAAYEAPEVP